MKPLARILAATDLSAPARHAVERGFLIAAAARADYCVMHALELDTMDALRAWLGDDLAQVKQKLEEQARETLLQQLADPARRHGVTARARIVAGTPLATIAEQSEALGIDLLVLGARGGDFLRHYLLGSTASRLLRKSRRHPVLIVKQAPHEAYRRALIPVDFSALSARAIELARQVAPGADIVLLHAYEAPFEGKLAYAGVDAAVIQQYRDAAREEALRNIRLVAAAAGLAIGDYSPLVVHGDPSQRVIEQEQERDCDLIVMGKHGASITEDLLLGSVTKHVLEEAQSDVLVVCGAG
jgi:nucleotide-binding universal stress UspA family protein